MEKFHYSANRYYRRHWNCSTGGGDLSCLLQRISSRLRPTMWHCLDVVGIEFGDILSRWILTILLLWIRELFNALYYHAMHRTRLGAFFYSRTGPRQPQMNSIELHRSVTYAIMPRWPKRVLPPPTHRLPRMPHYVYDTTPSYFVMPATRMEIGLWSSSPGRTASRIYQIQLNDECMVYTSSDDFHLCERALLALVATGLLYSTS